MKNMREIILSIMQTCPEVEEHNLRQIVIEEFNALCIDDLFSDTVVELEKSGRVTLFDGKIARC